MADYGFVKSQEKEIVNKPESWRVQASLKLGIDIKNVPYSAKFLTAEQKKKLNIPLFSRTCILKTKLGNFFQGFEWSDDGLNWVRN